jgi:uncharacterized NAD(P)/FAD-binding protein YdhS
MELSTIVIIGGGFSGTVTAAHLLNRGFGGNGRVIVINRSGLMARGVAYGTNSDQHVLNVPAGRMSAIEQDPDGFVHFLQHRGVDAGGEAFVSRHLYGAYLESLLLDAAARAPMGALQQISAEVVRIVPAAAGTHADVWLGDGSRIRADRVVLAIGNYPPQDPPLDSGSQFPGDRYIRDPWGREAFARLDRQQPVLLIGTGLTMIDIALQLQALDVTGPIIAISRRGLLPQPHRHPSHLPDDVPAVADLLQAAPTARAYVRRVRQLLREAAAQDRDWRDVIAALRPLTPRLWQAWPQAERARFMRHLRPFWEVHRHRMAPQLFDAFTRLRDSGQVTLLAGRLIDVHHEAGRVRVEIRLRGASTTRTIEVGTIVNCSGPAGDTRRLQDALFQSLQASGLIRCDPLGLGIDTSTDGTVIMRDGSPSPVIYYVGPFLRARDWEATAVPELRRAVRLTVDHLLANLPEILLTRAPQT